MLIQKEKANFSAIYLQTEKSHSVTLFTEKFLDLGINLERLLASEFFDEKLSVEPLMGLF